MTLDTARMQYQYLLNKYLFSLRIFKISIVGIILIEIDNYKILKQPLVVLWTYGGQNNRN